MSINHPFFKDRLRSLLVLASLILCLGADSCSQCKKPSNDESPTKKVMVKIVPLSSVALVGGDKKIRFKLQQDITSTAVDLTKLQLKITTSSTPASETNQAQILYNNTPTSELTGKQIGFDQEIILTLAITDLTSINTTEKVNITLQIIYEGKPLEGAGSSQAFVWEKRNATQALFQAIDNNNKAEAIALLDQGNIQVDAKNNVGMPLLHQAIIYNNDSAVIEKLLSLPNMDFNATGVLFKTPPLELAIQGGQFEIFKLLFEKGAQTKLGTTVFHVAIQNNSIPIIKYIINNYYEDLKNSQDKDGNTPLHIAVIKNYPDLANSLLTKGADRSIKNSAGKTPEELTREQDKNLKDPTNTTYKNLIGVFEGNHIGSL